MIHHIRRAASVLCVALAFTLTQPMAGAAEEDALTTAVKACAAIRKSSERLACYDNSVYPVATGATATAPPTPSAEEVFGAESSTVAAPAKEEATAPPPAREELSKITAHVTAMSTLPRGELQIELDNGQVWRQVEPHELLLHTGDSVTIARAALGTFRLTTSTGRVSKVQRLR
jgi:hypothetical protein